MTRGVRRRPLEAAACPRSGSLRLMTLISEIFKSQVCLSLTPLRGVSETETESPVSVRRSETLVRLRQTGFTETFYTPSEQGKHPHYQTNFNSHWCLTGRSGGPG